MALIRVCVLLAISTAAAAAAEPPRLVPAQGLEAYVEYDGLNRHRRAWEESAAQAILNQTPAGAMIADLSQQVTRRLLQNRPGVKFQSEDIAAVSRHLAHEGFILASHVQGETRASITVILPGGGKKETRVPIERMFRSLVESKNASTTQMRGRAIFRVAGERSAEAGRGPDTRIAWWFEGSDLIVLVGVQAAYIEVVLDVIDGKKPNATSHPGYAAAIDEGKAVPGWTPVGLMFIEPGKDGRFRNIFENSLDALVAGLNPIASVGLPPIIGNSAPLAPLDISEVAEAPADSSTVARKTANAASFEAPKRIRGLPINPPEATMDAPRIREKPLQLAPKPLPDPPISIPSDLPDHSLLKVFEPAGGLARPIPRANPKEALNTGIDFEGITRIVGRWGLHGKALFTVVRVAAPTPRKGLLAGFDARPFRKDALPAVPRDAKAIAVAALDPQKAFDKALSVVKSLAPEWGEAVAKTGAELKEVLEPLGTTWSVVSVPDPKRDGHSDAVLLATVRDPRAFVNALDSVAERFNRAIRDREARADDSNRGKDDDVPMLSLERLPAPEQGYRLTSPAELVRWFGEDAFEPTILVGKTSVALSLYAREARAALAAEADPALAWSPTGETSSAFEALPDELNVLFVRDQADSPWPGWFAELPSLVQLMAAAFEDEEAPKPETGIDLLGLLDLPAPGGFRVRIDRARVPTVDQIRAHLFPSVTAAAIDDRGIRLFRREAWPFACPAAHFTLKSSREWSNTSGFKRTLKVKAELTTHN